MKLHLSKRYNNNPNDTSNLISKTQTIDVVGNTRSSSKSYGCYLVKMSQFHVKNKSLSKSKCMPHNTNLLNRIKIKSNNIKEYRQIRT